MILTFNFATPGIPHQVRAGQVVSYSLPDGCQLRFSPDLVTWGDVTAASPFTAEADGHLRADCDTFVAPVAVELTISGGA